MSSLRGLRVVVTRAVHQAAELAEPLRHRGAEVLLVPVIGIAPPLDPAPLRSAIANCGCYDWIVFSSVNAVNAFLADSVSRSPGKPRIATVGPATRRVAEQHGLAVDLVPERYVAESLIEAFAVEDLSGKRILIPSAAKTRDLIPNALRNRGASVDTVEAYRNVIPPDAAEGAAEVFREPLPDWITFASSSAVENTIKLVGAALLQIPKIASIGPVTTETLRQNGLHVTAEADPHTIEGLVDAICRTANLPPSPPVRDNYKR